MAVPIRYHCTACDVLESSRKKVLRCFVCGEPMPVKKGPLLPYEMVNWAPRPPNDAEDELFATSPSASV